MRKTTLLVIIGLTSLTLMACSIFSFGQVSLQATKAPQTSVPEATKQSETILVPLEPVQPMDEAKPNNDAAVKSEPTPIQTIDPIEAAKACVSKTWEIEDLSNYVAAAIPQELADEYELEYQESTGNAYFILTPDGEFTLLAENLEIVFSAKAYVFTVPVTVLLDGQATGRYEVDVETLTIKELNTRGLTVSAQALGEEIVDPSVIMDSIPFMKPPFNVSTYTCEGDALQLVLPGYENSIPPLNFQAVE